MEPKKRKATLIGPNLEYIAEPRDGRKRQKISKGKYAKKGKKGKKTDVQAQQEERNQLDASQEPTIIHHPILSAYFPTLLPLRQYLALALKSSKSTATSFISRKERLLRFKSDGSALHNEVVHLLDATIVGVLQPIEDVDGTDLIAERVLAERANATQDERITSSQGELVDCAISILFQKVRTNGGWANSVLAAGYRINDMNTRLKTAHKFRQFGLDIICLFPNAHAAEFKGMPWKTITDIVGQETMLKLFAMQGDKEGAVFFPLNVLNRCNDPRKRNHKVHVLKYIFPRVFGLHNAFNSVVDKRDTVQTFKDYTLREEEIDLNISKSINDRRLKKILNKDVRYEQGVGCPDDDDDLHHGYMPPPNPLPDIGKKERKAYESVENIPQRFRGEILHLVGELIRLQRRCKYHPLLQHYCPSSVIDPNVPDPRPRVPAPPPSNQRSPAGSMQFRTQVIKPRVPATLGNKGASLQGFEQVNAPKQHPSQEISPQDPILLYTTTSHCVFVFLRAVIGNIVPLAFWGNGKAAIKNREMFFSHLEKFVKLRRYESLSLHEVIQGFKMTDLFWLHQKQPNGNGKAKLDVADMKQCSSLFGEFIYYLFDSLVIPLIRAHFYVTESTSDKNRTCYFRQDVWRKLTSTHINKMITTMFKDITSRGARAVMERRAAKFSTVRLLPKHTGVRFLSNLKRRPMELDPKTGRRVLAKSINQILKPNHVALSFEKSRQPQAVGAALFSVGEILKKLTAFRSRLQSEGVFGKQKFYFVKVDVTGCFDTIPQQHLLEVVERLYLENMYKIRKQGRVAMGSGKAGATKPRILFPQIGESADSHVPSIEMNKKYVADTSIDKKSLIFVDRVTCIYHERDALIRELREHVVNNFVQIGKRFYRQSVGIPQGSVMSTLLCNLFYADLETRELPFTQAKTGLLMRLIDDFLFITTNRDHAKRFSDAMHQGFPEYGVVIKPEKSLVNFEVDFEGKKIERLFGDTDGFPYCGALINEKTLEIKRDWSRRDGSIVSNLLTVEYGSKPGQRMLDKVLGGWKLLSSAIYLNTSFNSRPTVVTNLYWSFVDAGMKFYRYYRSLSCGTRNHKRKQTQPHKINERQILDLISEFMSLAYTLMMSREDREYDEQGNVIPRGGLVGRVQVRWLVAKAFLRVLGKKQTLFPRVLNWLGECVKANADKVDWVFYKAVDNEEVNEIFDSMRY
ncbi:hypothetical protein ABW20_dc0102400 [Dactylellina cionopaga]|nr:hypothetical protein ABW20_dc0102400 [Dactylellina cionopaga]